MCMTVLNGVCCATGCCSFVTAVNWPLSSFTNRLILQNINGKDQIPIIIQPTESGEHISAVGLWKI